MERAKAIAASWDRNAAAWTRAVREGGIASRRAATDAAIVRLDRSVADFADDASDHVPLVMRMVYSEEPGEPGPGDRGRSIEIPDGAQHVSLKFT